MYSILPQHLTTILTVGVLVGLFLVVLLKLFLQKEYPYIKKGSLMSEAEKKFFFVLKEILGDNYLIFSKVRLADLLYLPKMSNSEYYRYFNKIQSKHVDFVICDKENIKPLLVIELDDSSHLKLDRILRDDFINKIFESSKLTILHIRQSTDYNKADLLEKIRNDINTDTNF